jgi:hypothetical protein
MGQAKQRGSFEQRAVEAKKAEEVRMENLRSWKEDRRRAEAERERLMTPEERAKRRDAQQCMAIALGLSASFLSR